MNITLNRTVDLSSPILPEVLSAPLYEGEKNAHTFVIEAVKNKLPHPLSGSVVAYFERNDGNTVRVEGETKDGAAILTLSPECYQTGVFYLAVMLISDGAQTVIYAASGRVKNTQEGEIINGGDAIPTYDEIMAHLNKYLNANISAKVEQKEDGALITLTDAEGTTQAFVKNGKDGSGTGGGSGEGGKDGEDGATFTPSVDPEGNLSWTNDKNLPNPDPVNIKGPQGDEGEPGEPGKSAYEIAIDNGLSPDISEKDWLASLQGADGKSAYEIAKENGFKGTEEEWLYRTDNEPYIVNFTGSDNTLSDDFDYDKMVSAYNAGRNVYLVKNGTVLHGVLSYLDVSATFIGVVSSTWMYVSSVSKASKRVSQYRFTPYTLPTMSETEKGGAKVGAGLKMDGEALTINTGDGLEVVDGALRVKPEGEYELIDIIALGYQMLTEQPEDWETNFGNYYETTEGLLEIVANYRAWEPWKYFKTAEYEPVSKITVNKEPDGTPYNLKKMYISLTTPKGDSKKVGIVNVNQRPIVYNAGMIETSGAERGATTRIFCEIDGNILTNRAIAGGLSGGLGWVNANQYLGGFAILNQSSINYMQATLLNNEKFPAGTVLKIYGVRNNA